MDDKPELILKWGTVKGYYGCRKGTVFREKLQSWANISGVSLSVMTQENSDAHKVALCEVIDAVFDADGTVYNDWDGEYMSREKAKEYVNAYRR